MNFPWKRAESELQREIAHHLHQLTAEYQRQGYSPAEALRLAKREFGGSEQTKELCRDERSWAWLNGIRQDLVFGWRMMRRTPVVTGAAVLSLALAIGANTAIVSLMDLVLWRDLPVPAPRQLDVVNWEGRGFPRDMADAASGSMYRGDNGLNIADFFSYPGFQIMRQKVAGRASLAAFGFCDTVSVSFAGEPMVAKQRPVSGNLLSTLQVRPALGRLLFDSDDTRSAPATVVLSHRFWASDLSSLPDVVGRTIVIDNQPKIIAGVLESKFYGLEPGDPTDIYVPLHHGASATPDGRLSLDNDRFWGISLIARRNPGYPENQLRAALDAAFASSWSRQPKKAADVPHVRLDDGRSGLSFLRRDFRSPLLVLGGLVALLLMIACSNIANLLLSRAAAREKEVATRIALGCSRFRLARQFLTESAMLAVLGGVASIVVALATQSLLGQFVVPRHGDSLPIHASFDLRVLGVVAATSLVALLLFGVFPAWRASQAASAEQLKNNAVSVKGHSRHRWNSGRILTLGQMAMSIVLVMCAVLFTKNLTAIESKDPGFDRRNMILFEIRPGTSGYDNARLEHFYFNLERQLAATPGVTDVGLASIRPMNIGGRWDDIRVAGQTEIRNASINGITPTYLSLYCPRLIAGRTIAWTDIESNAKVAVVSEDLAQKLGGASALGKHFTFDEGPAATNVPTWEIVGIAPSMAATSMKERPFVVWVPLEKEARDVTVVLRTSQPPGLALAGVRKTMANIDRKLPLVDVVTMEEQISKGLQRERMFATVCSSVGILALVLSVVGLYGVIAYNTARRRGEIGIRLALGAMPREVVIMIVREGMMVAVVGLLLGFPVIWLGAKYVKKELFEMKPLDPATILLSTGTLLLAALVAVAIPALRASSIQPAQTLRQD
jgi:predicted permease